MSSTNMLTVEGNLAADADIKEVETRNGMTQVAEATIYVPFPKNRDNSFRIELSIWEGSSGWNALDYLKKGSLICVHGPIEPSAYTTSDGEPRAGLQMTPDRIDLKIVKDGSTNGNQQPEPQAAAA